MPVLMWIVIAFIAGVAEALTSVLVSVWFVVGAICAAIAANFGVSMQGQWLVFLGISVVLLILTAPLCKKLREKDSTPTNADRIIGSIGVITEDVEPVSRKSRMKVMGQEWSVIVSGDEYLKKGDTVQVDEIRGVHLIVSKYNESKKEG